MITHRPFGSGHPYRHELDQRVPSRPLVGEAFQLRALADPDITDIAVLCDDGSEIRAVRADPNDLNQEIGPFPARRSAEGHLASAAEASRLDADARVWVAELTAYAPLSYRMSGQRNGEPITTE